MSDGYERWCAVYFDSRGDLKVGTAFRSPLQAASCVIHQIIGIARLRIEDGKLASICVDKEVPLD